MNEDERRQRVRQIIAGDVAAAESHLLADFLLARIAEDADQAAKAVGRGIMWPRVADGVAAHDVESGRHVLFWHPARVLAECEAKRRIAEMHDSLEGDPYGEIQDRVVYWCALCDQDRDYNGIPHEEDGCDTLRLLALPYADHPDYREEWKPSPRLGGAAVARVLK